MAEELALNFPRSKMIYREQGSLLRDSLRQFHSVRVLGVNSFIREVGLYLQQDDGEAMLPVLEEIELSIYIRRGLGVLRPHERAGRPVKVYHRERMQVK